MRVRYEAKLKETFRHLLLSAATASVGCSGSGGTGNGDSAKDAAIVDATQATDAAAAPDATGASGDPSASDSAADATVDATASDDGGGNALAEAGNETGGYGYADAACNPSLVDASLCDFFEALPCGLPPDAAVENCYLALSECGVLCSQNPGHPCAIVECLANDGGGMPDATALTVVCSSGRITCGPGPGRRPEGLVDVPPARRGDTVGEVMADMARLEAAAVFAFRRMRDELLAWRAPRRLVRKAERSARDEVRHARAMRGLALRRGALPSVASKPASAPRSIEAFATENAIEGCVRESFAALVAHRQADRARDPHLRRVMRAIAADETRHAALSWEVARWVHARLDRDSRARVAAAMSATLSLLREEVATTPAPLASELGLPTGAEARALVDGFGAAILG